MKLTERQRDRVIALNREPECFDRDVKIETNKKWNLMRNIWLFRNTVPISRISLKDVNLSEIGLVESVRFVRL